MHRLPNFRALRRYAVCFLLIACDGVLAQDSTIVESQVLLAGEVAINTTAQSDTAAQPVTQLKATQSPVTASQVLLIVDQDCIACDELLVELEAEFAPMRLAGWRIGRSLNSHVRIVDKMEAAGILQLTKEETDGMRLPNVLATRGKEVVRYFKDGCSTPLDRWTFDWLITGLERRPSPPPMREVTVATTGNYPLRGSHWSVEGDWHPSRDKVLFHLRGPSHAQQLRDEWKLDAWSREELRSLHDNLHELVEFGRTNVYSSPINLTKHAPIVVSQ